MVEILSRLLHSTRLHFMCIKLFWRHNFRGAFFFMQPSSVQPFDNNAVILKAVCFDRKDPNTNFEVMIKDPKYKDVLFLFNDNFKDRNKNIQGGNSARIRPYTFQTPPRAVGVPTGWSVETGGFKALTEQVKLAITAAFERVNTILHEFSHIRRVCYSCDASNPSQLGFAIFRPAPDVISFIQKRLANIPARFINGLPISGYALNTIESKVELSEECHQIERFTQMFPPVKLSKRPLPSSVPSSSASSSSSTIPQRLQNFPIPKPETQRENDEESRFKRAKFALPTTPYMNMKEPSNRLSQVSQQDYEHPFARLARSKSFRSSK